MTKALSNAEISLYTPNMGLWLPNSDDVVFPPGTLWFRVQGTLGGTEYYGENGTYDEIFGVSEHTFGTYDGSVFSLTIDVADILGSGSISANFEKI